MIQSRIKNASLSQAMLGSLSVLVIAGFAALLLLWFADAQFERSQWRSADSMVSSEADRTARRSASAAEMAADIAFVQMPLSALTLCFLAISVLSNNRALKLASEANQTSKNALALEDKTRRITLRAYLHPNLAEGTSLLRTQFIDSVAPAATFRVSLDNSGQTPATKIKLFSTMGVGLGPDVVLDRDATSFSDFPDVPSLKSHVVTLRQAVVEAVDVNLSKNNQLYLRVVVLYYDVFGDEHGFDFVWQIEQTSNWFASYRAISGTVEVHVTTLSEYCRTW